jgi:hypothetical protein
MIGQEDGKPLEGRGYSPVTERAQGAYERAATLEEGGTLKEEQAKPWWSMWWQKLTTALD